jgi:3-hydroxyacyl-[acyl-carrier-protein] dehydratase
MSLQTKAIASSRAIEINAIMELLPHRFPLLLVDRVLDCVPGNHICGVKNLTHCESFFVGSASRERAMPHLLVIEALAQVSVILAFKTLELKPTGDQLVFFAGIENADFRDFARPGEQLLLRSEVRRIRKLVGWFHARAKVDGRLIVDVSMLAAIRTGRRSSRAPTTS